MGEIKKIDEVYQTLLKLEKRNRDGVSAQELSKELKADRANISRYLNELCRSNKLKKIKGRPVLYCSNKARKTEDTPAKIVSSFDDLVGARYSLARPIQQAKAAILYPPRGLHTLLLGETGVGKSMFAGLMHRFAIESKTIREDAPFIQFNCADYADNPQLVMAQIFGVKKGAYTGATQDREGLLKKADGGILFLDEVHRLSPQGQEMLFTYIDKGYFRPLGETEKRVTADVQIIAATTEDPESYLLGTFIRRIPMTITLPSLKDRGLEERYCLVYNFLKEESKRVGRSIYINRNSLISFLLYDCPNNIGQLSSDIQLACARAFLNYKTGNKKYLLISQADLPGHVKKGLMKLHKYREEIESLLQDKGDVLHFSPEDDRQEIRPEVKGTRFFYDIIEEKLNSLRQIDMDEDKINEILNIDIESHFQKHLENLPAVIRKEEIRKVVDEEVANTVDKILSLAAKKLKRSFDEKIYFGLALHLQKSIERISNGDKIYHPELNHIRASHADEFMVAMEAARIIDNKFGIETPLDEIGYLTMFLIKNPYKTRDKVQKKVAVFVIMHGNSTASSMVEVANKLIGTDHAIPLDMPLNMNPEEIFELALKEVNKLERSSSVILLVDMGSLTNFGEMLAEKTGREVKTIDMVSTPVVIDVCRKAVLGQDINEIYRSCRGNRYSPKLNVSQVKAVRSRQKNAIITTCFTGEGAAEKLKEVIEKELPAGSNCEVLPLNILNKEHYLAALKEYKEYYNIIAVVGTVEVEQEGLPFISAVELLSGEGLNYLKRVITELDVYSRIKESLKEHIKVLDSEKLVEDVRQGIINIEEALKLRVPAEVKVGIVLHMSFLIEKLKKGIKETEFPELKEFRDSYQKEMALIKKALVRIEKNYSITISENELAYLCKMFTRNQISGSTGGEGIEDDYAGLLGRDVDQPVSE
ncbi:MAG: hypothetical protein PWR10_2442 [Halanaerobiales bacterium]|nr:hypothetical protein [Halanaerobiales bacterium]